MIEVSRDSFGDRLAKLLGLQPEDGRTFTCTIPQGTFRVTISPQLSEGEKRRYEMLTGSRSIHIEGYFQSHGIDHQFSFDDRDGDGMIGPCDDGGIFDSAQFFVCEETNGMAQSFYTLLAEIIEDYLRK